MAITHDFTPITDRPLSDLAADKSALFAIAQAAVNVELFTIPLYMTSLYSLYGTHQITGPNDFYLGRQWPGMATSANPKTNNQKAFNAVFSVFIAEMLHLQLASNICKAIGVAPSFTSEALQNSNFGWTCYSFRSSTIPHIIDLQDTTTFENVKVNLGPLNAEQVKLFLAIEETEKMAEDAIKKEAWGKYFPDVPFAGWQPDNTEADLPLFGSIGYMYLCLFKYLTITYTDNETLWQKVFQAKTLQRDLFNVENAGHPLAEYPDMSATVTGDTQDKALSQVIDMIQGITDQGEGSGVIPQIRKVAMMLMKNPANAAALQPVKPDFQPSKDALEKDYPTYDEKGNLLPQSRDAEARSHYGKMDHYETFAEIQRMLTEETADPIVTWDQWHAQGHTWTADMLQTPEHVNNKYPIPSAGEIAGALNRLKQKDTAKNHQMISQVVTGAIKGVTTVLNDYWSGKTGTFPFPSMAGSGDRMSLCWAIFGQAPDLSKGVTAKTPGLLYHACQGMNLDPNNVTDPNHCAAVEVFHTCKGSNTCAAEGGCGFVQSTRGGGSCGGSSCSTSAKQAAGCGHSGCGAPAKAASGCGHGCGASSKKAAGCGHGCGSNGTRVESNGAMMAARSAGCGQPAGSNAQGEKNLCGGPTPTPKGPVYYGAPSDNRCASFGGCAVPISASQMYPSPDGKSQQGQMELFNYLGTEFTPMPINTMAYGVGDLVYDVAWNAYIAVLQARNRPIPAKPKPSDIRLAFPPST